MMKRWPAMAGSETEKQLRISGIKQLQLWLPLET